MYTELQRFRNIKKYLTHTYHVAPGAETKLNESSQKTRRKIRWEFHLKSCLSSKVWRIFCILACLSFANLDFKPKYRNILPATTGKLSKETSWPTWGLASWKDGSMAKFLGELSGTFHECSSLIIANVWRKSCLTKWLNTADKQIM